MSRQLDEETIFLTNDARITGYPHAKESNGTITTYHLQKLTQSDYRTKYNS